MMSGEKYIPNQCNEIIRNLGHCTEAFPEKNHYVDNGICGK
jgi:hypothetical protein